MGIRDSHMHVSLTPVAVVGAGALGCFFGGMLARAGASVTLIGRAAHVAAIRRDGLVLESRGERQAIPVAATEDMAAVRDARLVLFCVKSADTDDAARALAPHLGRDAVVLSLQNGVNNVERIRAKLESRAENRVLPGLVYTAAEMAGPGHVRHTGGGSLVIGQLKAFARADGSDRRVLDEVAALFRGAGVAVTISE